MGELAASRAFGIAFACVIAVAIACDAPAYAQSALDDLLISAARHRHVAEVNSALAGGANPNARSSVDRLTPLTEAASCPNNAEILAILIRHGSAVDATEERSGRTALAIAVSLGNFANIEPLLRANADPNVRDLQGNTALMLAVAPPPLIHQDPRSAAIGVVSVLVAHGANPNRSNNVGLSPFRAALEDGRQDVLRLLRSNGGHTANEERYAAFGYARSGDIARLRLAMAHGAPIEGRDHHGCTLLLAASAAGQAACVALLAGRGASTRARDGEHRTPLIAAAAKDRSAAIIALIKAGADLSLVDDRGYNALHVAAYSKNKAAIAALLEHGAKADRRDHDGQTPLMDAVGERWTYSDVFDYGGDDPDLVKLFISHGADVNARTPDGITALDIARGLQKQRTVAALIVAGAPGVSHGGLPSDQSAEPDPYGSPVRAYGGRPMAEPPQPNTGLSRDDRETLSFALSHKLLADQRGNPIRGNKGFVLQRETIPLSKVSVYFSYHRRRHTNKEDREAFHDFAARNRVEIVASVPAIGTQISPVSKASIAAAFKPHGWQSFYQHFPDANGLLTLSTPGYSANRSTALVYVTWRAASLAGEGELILLRRSGAGWTCKEVVAGWRN